MNQYHKFWANCMEDLQDLRWLVYVRLFVPRFIGCLVCPSFMYILLMSATEASKASAKAGSTFCLHFTALSITAWCASKCATIWILKISYHILIFILVDLPKLDLQNMARKGLKWQTKKSIKINCPSIPVKHRNIWKTAPAKPKCSQHRWWKGSLDHLEASRAGTSSTQTWGSRSCPHAPGPNVPWSFVISHYVW